MTITTTIDTPATMTQTSGRIRNGRMLTHVDLVHSANGDRFLVPRAAWNDQLEDLSGVIDTQKSELIQTAMDASRFYNNNLKKYSCYSVPIKCSTLLNSVW